MRLNSRGVGTGMWRSRVLLAFVLLVTAAAIGLGLGTLAPQATRAGNREIVSPPPFLYPSPAKGGQNIRVAYGQLPLIFERNQGQSDARVQFLARGTGYGLFLTADEAVLVLQSPPGPQSSARNPSVLRMQLAGANPNLAVIGADPLPGRSNYFIGNDPSRWRRDIPQFARVRYPNAYPGIDLVYYGHQGRLEYDFELAPGADPAPVTLRFEGAKNLSLDADGNLTLRLPGGEVQLHAPRVYQQIGGEQQPVSARFVPRGRNEVGFALGAYDRSRALVIDPVLSYSSYFGGTGDEACSVINALITGTQLPISGCPAVAVDTASNIYLAGSTTSTSASFPLSSGAFQSTLAGTANVFVTKLDSTGSTILFSTYLGGDKIDTSAGVAFDSGLNVIVAGSTTSTNFPFTPSAFQKAPASVGQHVFVSELDPTGHTLVYSTYLSGSGRDTAAGLALDFLNKIYVIGTTTSTPPAPNPFPTTLGAFQTCTSADVSPAPPQCAAPQFFLSKIDPVLSGPGSLPYSTFFGGGNPSSGALTLGGGIAVDTAEPPNVYITGGTNYLHTGIAATDFPIFNAYQSCLNTPPTSPTPPCTSTAPPLQTDAFVAKLNPSASPGTQLLYSTYLGGSGNDVGNGIAVDTGFNAYVTGSTNSTDFIIPTGATPFQECLDTPLNPVPPAKCPSVGANPPLDAFLAKLGNLCIGTSCTTSTVPLTYFSYLGGSETDVGMAIALDPSTQATQGARITGWTNSTNFPLNPITGVPIIQQTFGGGQADAFVSRIDTTATLATAAGNYGTYLGGSKADFGTAITTDSQGNTYVAGETASTDFPTKNAFQSGLKGNTDAFVSKLGPIQDLVFSTPLPAPSPPAVGVGSQVTFTYPITNSGDTVSNVTVTETMPTFPATFVSATASGSGSSSSCGGLVGNSVQCNLGTIPAGSTSVTVSLTVTATAPSVPSQNPIMGHSSAQIGNAPSINSLIATVNDFTVAVAPTAPPPIVAGAPASFTVTVTPTGNIPESVTLAATTGLPANATATFPGGSSIPNLSSGAVSRTLVINTQPRVTTSGSLWRHGGLFYATLLPVSGLALLGIGAAGKTRARRRLLLAVLLAGCLAFILFQAACGTSSPTTTTTGTPAGTYPISVTATSGGSGAAVRTAQLTLTVK